MKLLFLSIVIACSLQIAPSQANNVQDCIYNAVVDMGMEDLHGGAEWLADLRSTTERLMTDYRRCQDMLNESMKELCMLRWQAQVLYQSNRLQNGVRAIAGEEKSQQFLNAFLRCFGV